MTDFFLFRTLVLLKPDATSKLGIVINCLRENDLQVVKARMGTLSRQDAARFYEGFKAETFFKYVGIASNLPRFKLLNRSKIRRLIYFKNLLIHQPLKV